VVILGVVAEHLRVAIGAPASGTAPFLNPLRNRIGAPASGTAFVKEAISRVRK
jgi:hypothetical protein